VTVQAEAPPPQIIQVAPVQAVADFVVVARDIRNEVVTSADQPLPLVKAGRGEEALLRQAVFVTATTTITRPTTPGPDTYRWTYESFLQRQVCFTSMTGLFACTAAEVAPLPDRVSGEVLAPPPPAEGQPLVVQAAEAAHLKLFEGLRVKAAALFEDDRRARVDPVFRAAGVTVRRRAN
jgi:hypothetical protein